jgi:hypothetical protein
MVDITAVVDVENVDRAGVLIDAVDDPPPMMAATWRDDQAFERGRR